MKETKLKPDMKTCPKCGNKSLIEYLQEETETDFPEHSYQCPCGYSSVIFDGAATATGQATTAQNKALKKYRDNLKKAGKPLNNPVNALKALNKLREKKEKIEVWLEPEQAEKIRNKAKAENIKVTDLIRNFIENLS